MSRQKRGVHYVQQDEPAFLKRMKQQAGYKEGPTVDTKRQDLPERDSDSDTEQDDERPQVVVLKSGDLTADQATLAEKEAAVKPREATNEKVIFKKPSKTDKSNDSQETSKHEKKKSTAKKIKNSSLLSFNDDDDEDYD